MQKVCSRKTITTQVVFRTVTILALYLLGACYTVSRESKTGIPPQIDEVVLTSSHMLDEKFDRRYSEKPVAAAMGNFGQLDFSGSRLRSLSQSYGAMTARTELRFPSDTQSVPLCGPSSRTNELVCFDQENGELLDRMPIPGDLSAAPLFHNGSWILATTKGFLIRTGGLSDKGTPVLGMESFAFWGAESRSRMAFLRNEYRSETAKQSSAKPAPNAGNLEKKAEAAGPSEKEMSGLQYLQVGWSWYHWSSAEFVSHLLVQGSRVVGMTSNQFVYAIEFETGKIDWATRLATNEDLKIASRALAVSSRYIIVGNSDGQLNFLNPATGKLEWHYEFNKDPAKRFSGVVSQPLVVGQRVLASNASSQTSLINEKTQKAEWTIPFGSVAAPRRIGENFFIGTAEGKVLKLDGQSGKTLAEIKLTSAEPVASLAVADGGVSLLAALRGGRVFQLNAQTLEQLREFSSMGVVKGEFIGSESFGANCLTTLEGIARCFASSQQKLSSR